MFPIASDRLMVREIADYWATEIAAGDVTVRKRREKELKGLFAAAWWRGEIGPTKHYDRMEMLQVLFSSFGDEIRFELPAKNKESDLKRLKRLIHQPSARISVPLPNAEVATWTLESCTLAFEALAEGWGLLEGDEEADPAIYSTEPTVGHRILNGEIEEVTLTRDEFFNWVASKGYARSYFWSRGNAARNVAVIAETRTAKTASTAKIHRAITEVYDLHDSLSQKPPNINEIGREVQKLLITEGQIASIRTIQEAAQEPQHAHRRRPAGKTLASERKPPLEPSRF